MDYTQALTLLKSQIATLDSTILTLQKICATAPQPVSEFRTRRSGRKSMEAEEREIVSVRMKKYWAGRREEKANHA